MLKIAMMSTSMKTQQTTKAILIDMTHPRVPKEEAKDRMEELEDLVETYGGIVVVKRMQKRVAPHPRTYIGPGKVDELGEESKENGATVLIVNAQLKPRQIYDLSEMLRPYGIKVWDRIDLILKIFAKHASTTEARLEIELASIRHMGPRIFGMGMELSRQAGGIGTVGVGETNTEIMKRHLKEKERIIKKKLDKYKKGRELVHSGRRRRGLKTVSVVGYTNAGKTTLLNALTGRKEYAADALFATLDTRVGEMYLPEKRTSVLLSDTIGFIKELPPELLNAFSSTLSEAVGADLLLHVADASDKNFGKNKEVVEEILARLGLKNTPQILVLNKIDKMKEDHITAVENRHQEEDHVWVSAVTKQGLEELVGKIEKIV